MICGRGGPQNSHGRRIGKHRSNEATQVICKVQYLITADPRHVGLPQGERLALVAAHNTCTYLPIHTPERFAEDFVGRMQNWMLRMRGERKASQYLCVDRFISFAPDDPITPSQALAIAEEMIEKVMGPLANRLALLAVHTDKGHMHVHFIVSIVDNTGAIFNPHHDDLRWMAAMDELEVKHGLRRVVDRGWDTDGPLPPRPRRKPKGTRPPPYRPPPQKDTRSRPVDPLKTEFRRIIDHSVRLANEDFKQFVKTLNSRGMQLIGRFKPEASGTIACGVSFYRDGERFRGTDLGPAYTWPNLAKRVGFAAAHISEWATQSKAFVASCVERCTLRQTARAKPFPPAPNKKKKLKPITATFHRYPILQPIDTANREERGFHWSRGKIAFRELTQGEDSAREIVLETEMGANRKIVAAMLERAQALGWRGVEAKGSELFKRAVESIRHAWHQAATVKATANNALNRVTKKTVVIDTDKNLPISASTKGLADQLLSLPLNNPESTIATSAPTLNTDASFVVDATVSIYPETALDDSHNDTAQKDTKKLLIKFRLNLPLDDEALSPK